MRPWKTIRYRHHRLNWFDSPRWIALPAAKSAIVVAPAPSGTNGCSLNFLEKVSQVDRFEASSSISSSSNWMRFVEVGGWMRIRSVVVVVGMTFEEFDRIEKLNEYMMIDFW